MLDLGAKCREYEQSWRCKIRFLATLLFFPFEGLPFWRVKNEWLLEFFPLMIE